MINREICIRYADMERKLGEIDRARAIYVHCSQICDPKVIKEYFIFFFLLQIIKKIYNHFQVKS